MKQLFVRLLSFFNTIQGKIAFYPALLAFAGLNLAFVMQIVEEYGVSNDLMEVLPRLILENGDTALTIMSTCVGGLISMMVFSFSMVMLLLSQASSNYSPRLLPGLISDKRHQIILGFYMATIIYTIFTLFSIEPSDEEYSLPGISILLSIFLTILCLASFIYFIHNISQSIQITNILDKIYTDSKERLMGIIKVEEKRDRSLIADFPDTKDWHKYTVKTSGYFQNISIENMLNICKEKEIKIYITRPKGFFILQHDAFIKTDKAIEQKTLDAILSNINFARGELISDNYILAFKQITEIAVKAMSPGINDPGTCINAIDYLTELFALRMLKRDSGIIVNKKEAQLRIAIVSFEELLYNCMASLRTYCKNDPIIAQKLIGMLLYLRKQNAFNDSYIKCVEKEILLLKQSALDAFDTDLDKEVLENLSNYSKFEK